jgi:hypothetical protein
LSDDLPRDPDGPPRSDTEPGSTAGEESQDSALDEVIARLAKIAGSLQRLLDVRVARARVEMRERAFRAQGWLLVFALLLALTVIASLYVLRGLSGMLTGMLWNISWAGDLAAGAAGLLLALATGMMLRARLRRRNLRRIRDRFQDGPTPGLEGE